MSLTPGQILLHYRLVEPIGEGGMGVVWKAVDTTLDREVAVKILPPGWAVDAERLGRFEREAKVLASLNHANVATVHGFHEDRGVRFLVMELVPGETLEERLKRGPMPPDEAIPIARRIVDGIEYAHERGIVHRDLKPANVKLTGDGGVKVLDFGLAKAIAGDPTSSGPTSTPAVMPTLTSMGTVAGMILGTAAYMSPEQARGTNIDRRADIWAFGAVLFEMLSGKRAFEGDTVSDTLASVLRAPVEWDALPSTTPPSVVRLLKRCLERDPKKRLRDIGEARIALDTMGQGDDIGSSSTVLITDVVPSRFGLPWALFALAAVTAAFLGAKIATQKPPEARVVRFDIQTDAKLSRMDWPRLSPDGRILAFQGFDTGGKIAIWVRPLASMTAYPLAGTEGVAGRPFWSPDSRFLAYFDGPQLRKVPVAGGPPQTIGEAEYGADGTWGKTGTILFDGRGAADAIRQIPASGGKPTAVFPTEVKDKVQANAWPFFLPDGKHFLFTAAGAGGSTTADIFVGAVGSSDVKRLTESASRVEYANGSIIYVLRGTLVAHRFDPDRLELSGDPVPLADHVSENGTRALFSASQTGAIAYLAGGTQDNSELLWLDRSGKELGKIGEPDAYFDAALSPDGTRLAFSLTDRRSSTHDIWVRDLARDTSSRLTFDEADDVRPVWSPDGTRVYYASNNAGPYVCMAKAANGMGTEEQIYKDKEVSVSPENVSADGRLMVLNRIGPGVPGSVVVIPADGKGEPVTLPGSGAQFQGKFSPDGRFIVYQSNESRTAEVYVQTWPLGGGKWQISNGGGLQPKWSADGKEIFYRTPDFEFFSAPIALGPQLSAGIPKLLFKRRLQGGPTTWTVARDGQKFVMNVAPETASSPAFMVVLNWPEALNAR